MPNETLQIDESFKRIELTLRWLGIYSENNKRSAAQNIMYKFRYLISFVVIHSVAIASTAWCIKSIADGTDLTEVTRIGSTNVFVLLGDVKCVSLLVYENSINELMAALRDLETEENDRERPDEIKEMIKRKIGFLNRVLKIYMFGIRITCLYFLGETVFVIANNYFRNHELKLYLPMNVVFPFDPYDIRVWPFVFVYQSLMALIVASQAVAADSLFFICCTYLQISFITLGHDFEEIIEKSYRNIQFHITTDELKNKLAFLVKRHQNITDAVTILDKIYGAANFGNFLATSLVICLNAFNMTKMNSFALAVGFLLFLSTSLSQIFLICYFADMLTDQSMRVSEAIYNCNWYLVKKSFVKSLQIVQHRAQKPCKITTAYGFADVNLLAFSKIINTSWSYFTLLSAVYSEDK